MKIKVNLGRTGFIEEERIKPIQNSGLKPIGGLWGTETEYADKHPDYTWEAWCRSEMPHYLSEQSATITLNDNARVLDVSTPEALELFVNSYCSDEIQIAYHKNRSTLLGNIDYEKMSRDYDVVSFDIFSIRQLSQLIPSLDVSSSLILNKECIESIENPKEITPLFPFHTVVLDEKAFNLDLMLAAEVLTNYEDLGLNFQWAGETNISDALNDPGTVVLSTDFSYDPKLNVYGINPITFGGGEEISTLSLMAENEMLDKLYYDSTHYTLSEKEAEINDVLKKMDGKVEKLVDLCTEKISEEFCSNHHCAHGADYGIKFMGAIAQGFYTKEMEQEIEGAIRDLEAEKTKRLLNKLKISVEDVVTMTIELENLEKDIEELSTQYKERADDIGDPDHDDPGDIGD